MTRRDFLAASLTYAGSAPLIKRALAAPEESQPVLQKALLYSMLPEAWSIPDKFKFIVDVGFDGVEMPTITDNDEEKAIHAAAEKTGVRVHSVMNGGNWEYPLSSDKPEMVKKGLEILTTSLHNAKAWGADTVLLVPGIVTPETRYQQVWERSQREIRTILPLAEELNVTMAIENVGNKFLLSPLEFVRYIDEFASPFLQAYFDIGNCLYLGGYPHDWMLNLGQRIKKVHLKDCKTKKHEFVALGHGDVDWPIVRKTLTEIGFSGFCTAEPNYRDPELKADPRAYFKGLALQIDRIFEGE